MLAGDIFLEITVFCSNYLYLPVLCVGYLGHFWTWFIFSRRWTIWKSNCRIYFLAMSLSDVLALTVYLLPEFFNVTLSQWGYYGFYDWVNKVNLNCKIYRYLLYVSIGSSYLVVAFSIERLAAIVMPLRAASLLTTKRAIKTVSAIILAFFIISIPAPLAYFADATGFGYCMLDAQLSSNLYMLLIVLTMLVTVPPPVILLLVNGVLLVQVYKLKVESRKTRKISAKASKTAKLIAELMIISLWTNVAILPMISLAAMLTMALDPKVLSDGVVWPNTDFYAMYFLSQVAIFLMQANSAVSWIVYNARVAFFWTDTWDYLRLKCEKRV